MTTKCDDLIRRAAEYVGAVRPEHGSAVFLLGKKPTLIRFYDPPRWAIHALTGLVEDKVRDGFPHLDLESCSGLVDGKPETWFCIRAAGKWTKFKHEDPLIARLGALMQLVEKVDV
jgi:hypothetical protein